MNLEITGPTAAIPSAPFHPESSRSPREIPIRSSVKSVAKNPVPLFPSVAKSSHLRAFASLREVPVLISMAENPCLIRGCFLPHFRNPFFRRAPKPKTSAKKCKKVSRNRFGTLSARGSACSLRIPQSALRTPHSAGWHICRMAFPKHIELHRSGIFEPE